MMEGFELIEREANSSLDMAREFNVTCDEDYSEAGAFIVNCKALIAKIKVEFAEPKRKADEAHKSITAMERRILEPVQRALDLASSVALVWKREQDRLAKEEADKIAAAKRKEEEERRIEEAAALEAKGDTKAAEEVVSAPMPFSRGTKFVSPTPKVAGLSDRTSWKAQVIDPKSVKREFCTPDQTLINFHVNRFWPKGTPSHKKILTEEQKKLLENEIGGVEIFEESTFVGRVG